MRVKLARGEDVRFWTQQQFLSAIQEAIAKSGLPVARAGDRGRYKMTSGPPLSLGQTSRCEYVDIELTVPVTATEFAERLRPHLPTGIVLLWQRRVPRYTASLKAAARVFRYCVKGVFDPQRARAFYSAASWPYCRTKHGRTLALDVRRAVVHLEVLPDRLVMDIAVQTAGTPKPAEVVEAVFGIPFGRVEELEIERIAVELAPSDRPQSRHREYS